MADTLNKITDIAFVILMVGMILLVLRAVLLPVIAWVVSLFERDAHLEIEIKKKSIMSDIQVIKDQAHDAWNADDKKPVTGDGGMADYNQGFMRGFEAGYIMVLNVLPYPWNICIACRKAIPGTCGSSSHT